MLYALHVLYLDLILAETEYNSSVITLEIIFLYRGMRN